MRLVLTIPAIVTVVGALTYGLANGKLSEIGRISFAMGLLAVLVGLR